MNCKKLFLVLLVSCMTTPAVQLYAAISDLDFKEDCLDDENENKDRVSCSRGRYFVYDCIKSFVAQLYSSSIQTGDDIYIEKNCNGDYCWPDKHTKATNNTDPFTVRDIKPNDKRYPKVFPQGTKRTFCKEIYRPRLYTRWAKWFALAEEKYVITYFHDGITSKNNPNPGIVSSFRPSWQAITLGTTASILGTAAYAWSIFKKK